MDWFERWFGSEYLDVYPHRDAEEAQRAVGLIDRVFAGGPESRVLDLACGAGRHARELADRWWTTGLDLSFPLLHLARRDVPSVAFVRGDMRELPYADQTFHLVVNLFTSFGYFDNDAQHLRVLSEVGRVIRRGGTFVLDFFNAPYVQAHLVPYDERRVGDQVVEQHRRISDDGRYVEKHIVLRCDGREYRERVRLFTMDELGTMLEESGFAVTVQFGDYTGKAYHVMSPRAILCAVRE